MKENRLVIIPWDKIPIDPKAYEVPSPSELDSLTIEISCMLGVYTIVLAYTIYNIVAYLCYQKRYKNWLISAFYFLSVLVLLARMSQYSFTILMYHSFENHPEIYTLWEAPIETWREVKTDDFKDVVFAVRYLDVSF